MKHGTKWVGTWLLVIHLEMAPPICLISWNLEQCTNLDLFLCMKFLGWELLESLITLQPSLLMELYSPILQKDNRYKFCSLFKITFEYFSFISMFRCRPTRPGISGIYMDYSIFNLRHNPLKPWFYTPDYIHQINWQTFDPWHVTSNFIVLCNVSSSLVVMS